MEKAKSGCKTCKLRAYVERKPKSLFARLWRWHTGWRPGWKAYRVELAGRQEASGTA